MDRSKAVPSPASPLAALQAQYLSDLEIDGLAPGRRGRYFAPLSRRIRAAASRKSDPSR
jgi:hypothetical protein